MDLKKLDVRTVKRYLAKGRVTQEDYDKHLAALPDLEEEAEFVDYASQFAEEDAKRQAEQAPAEPAPAPAPAPEPAASAAQFSAGPHSAPPATVAPASVAPSAVASVPRARPMVTETPSGEDGSSEG